MLLDNVSEVRMPLIQYLDDNKQKSSSWGLAQLGINALVFGAQELQAEIRPEKSNIVVRGDQERRSMPCEHSRMPVLRLRKYIWGCRKTRTADWGSN